MNEIEEIKAEHRAMQRASTIASRLSNVLSFALFVFVIARWRSPLGPAAYVFIVCTLALNLAVIVWGTRTQERRRARLHREIFHIDSEIAASFDKIYSSENNRSLARSNWLTACAIPISGVAILLVRGHPTPAVLFGAIGLCFVALGAIVWSLIEARRVLARLRRAGSIEERPDYLRACARFRRDAERLLRMHAERRRHRGEDPEDGIERLAMFDAWREVMTWCLVAASERGFDPGQAIDLLLKVTHVACDEALALIARRAIDEHMKKHHPEENPPSADHLN